MVATRQDAWTEQDDLYLADVTLRSIRNGDTQLAAFEEVAAKLGRTSAACGFRWNSVVRKQYETSILLAKEQRSKKEKTSKSHAKQEIQLIPPTHSSREHVIEKALLQENEISVEQLIAWLQKNKMKLDEDEQENERLKNEVSQLREELTRVQAEYRMINEDYKTFIQMMERARKMTLLGDEQQTSPRLRFRMESNGNLEHFA